MPDCTSCDSVNACTESDTCRMLSCRRWAVTTISARASFWGCPEGGGACCPRAGAVITGNANRDAANKRIRLELKFITTPLLSHVERLCLSPSFQKQVVTNRDWQPLFAADMDPPVFSRNLYF